VKLSFPLAQALKERRKGEVKSGKHQEREREKIRWLLPKKKYVLRGMLPTLMMMIALII